MDREIFEKAYYKKTGFIASRVSNEKGYTDFVANMCWGVCNEVLQSMQGEAVGQSMGCGNPDNTIATFNADRVPVGTKLYTQPQSPAVVDDYAALLKESAELFRFYEQSHRVRGPEHLEKASRNAEIAGRIEDMLTASGKGE